jgi:hypothetical protein
MSAARGMAGFHRFARLLALAAFVLSQPLAAFHFATDEAHLANAAISIQVAHGGHMDGPEGHASGGGHRPAHGDQLCDFCLLAGAALAPPPGAALLALAWALPPDTVAAEAVRPRQQLKIGHPTRAPPRAV